MSQLLTEKVIRAFPLPARGSKIYYDAVQPGFGVRITAAGIRAFVLNFFTKDGRERRLTIGSPPAWNLARAREAAKDYRRRIDGGEDPLSRPLGRARGANSAGLGRTIRTGAFAC